MNIDLTLLHSQTVKEVDITNSYTIPSNYFENTSVLKIEDIKVEGKVYMNASEDDEEELTDYIEASIKGDIILSDSISLEPVSYPVSIEINDILDQNCKKSENTLDIFQFLWENIVLEVPLQFTKVEDLSKFHGDGWKLISEEELVSNNNPFSDLLKDFNKLASKKEYTFEDFLKGFGVDMTELLTGAPIKTAIRLNKKITGKDLLK